MPYRVIAQGTLAEEWKASFGVDSITIAERPIEEPSPNREGLVVNFFKFAFRSVVPAERVRLVAFWAAREGASAAYIENHLWRMMLIVPADLARVVEVVEDTGLS